jgi:hypothetical protein
MSSDAVPSSRRARRARELVFGKARSFEEHTAQGIQYWQAVPLAKKFEAIVELVRDSWYLEGKDGSPPRLDRSTHGVRKIRG